MKKIFRFLFRHCAICSHYFGKHDEMLHKVYEMTQDGIRRLKVQARAAAVELRMRELFGQPPKSSPYFRKRYPHED